jgi:hypothetical protein
MTHPVSWLSLLRTARAPLTVVALAAIALVLPPQSSDMLAAVGDDGHAVGFYLALALLTFSGWYWTRALIAARFDVPHSADGLAALQQTDARIDPYAYDAVPWIVFFLTFLLGLGLILRSGTQWTQVLAGLPLLIWLALFILYRPGRRIGAARVPRRIAFGTTHPYRSVNQGQPRRSTGTLRDWWRALPVHFRLLVNRAPGGPEVAGTFIGLALFLFFWGAFASFVTFPDPFVSLPIALAAIFHGPSAALFIAALIIAPLSVITFLADGYRLSFTIGGRTTGPARPPVIAALAIWVALAPWVFHLHTVRITETVAHRQPLDALFQQWAAACAPGTGPVQPIIVAVSGGASTSAVWGARVLQEAEEISGPGRAVFAVSSVSGGSLGAAAYMALLADLTPEELCKNGTVTEARKARARLLAEQPLGHDVLGALLAGALAVDIPRNLLSPFAVAARVAVGGQPRGGDRAEAIERAFEVLFPIGENNMPFMAPYLLLFYGDLGPQSEPPAGRYRAGMPLWIANGTDTGSGGRLLTVPFDAKASWPFGGAGDVLSMLGGDVPISTAIDNTTRFAYLEPSGELLRDQPRTATRALRDRLCDQVRLCTSGSSGSGSVEIVDGGYFENEGLQTVLDLAQWLETKGSAALGGRAVRPIILQATATGSPDVTPAEVVRVNSPPDDPTKPQLAPAPLQILAPLVGLNAARGGHSAVLLRRARDKYQERFFHFFLPGQDGREVPLNWVLSDATTAFIRGAICEQTLSGNRDELDRLHKAAGGPLPPTACPR